MTKKSNKFASREISRLLLIGIPIMVIAAIATFVYRANQPTQEATALQVSENTVLIRPDSPILGALDAPVTIVEFLDPECESCRAVFPFMKQVLQEYDGRVRLVVRYFPLHNNSVLAATATEAAGAQGKYWEMQELLFTNQREWGEQRSSQIEKFIAYAEELGLNVEQFKTDLQREDYAAKIERDKQDGESLGVRGTPTIFINGTQVTELSGEAIIGMIEDELNNSTQDQ